MSWNPRESPLLLIDDEMLLMATFLRAWPRPGNDIWCDFDRLERFQPNVVYGPFGAMRFSSDDVKMNEDLLPIRNQYSELEVISVMGGSMRMLAFQFLLSALGEYVRNKGHMQATITCCQHPRRPLDRYVVSSRLVEPMV